MITLLYTRASDSVNINHSIGQQPYLVSDLHRVDPACREPTKYGETQENLEPKCKFKIVILQEYRMLILRNDDKLQKSNGPMSRSTDGCIHHDDWGTNPPPRFLDGL